MSTRSLDLHRFPLLSSRMNGSLVRKRLRQNLNRRKARAEEGFAAGTLRFDDANRPHVRLSVLPREQLEKSVLPYEMNQQKRLQRESLCD